MEIKDILTLARAGFTAEQISRFAAISQPAQPVQPVQPAQPVQPVQPAQPVQPVQPAQPVQPVQQENDFAAQLAALTAAIHANGILGSEQPKQETAEDILASIINPPAKDAK